MDFDELLQLSVTIVVNYRCLITWLKGRQKCYPQKKHAKKPYEQTLILPSFCVLMHNFQESKMIKIQHVSP